MRFALTTSLVLTALATARLADAEEFTHRRYTLPDGSFEITGEPARPKIMGISMSRNSAGQPIYIAPHFYWGVTDIITLGITHGDAMELFGKNFGGLCITGQNGGCPKVYDDVGFGMLIGLTHGDHHDVNLHLGVPISSFDPFTIGTKVGVLARLNAGRLVAFVFDPYVYFGFTHRNRGNREHLILPLWIYFQPAHFIAPFVGTSFDGPIDGFTDNVRIPLEGGVVFEVADNVDLGVVFRFPNLMGHNGTVDWRELGLMARFRF